MRQHVRGSLHSSRVQVVGGQIIPRDVEKEIDEVGLDRHRRRLGLEPDHHQTRRRPMGSGCGVGGEVADAADRRQHLVPCRFALDPALVYQATDRSGRLKQVDRSRSEQHGRLADQRLNAAVVRLPRFAPRQVVRIGRLAQQRAEGEHPAAGERHGVDVGHGAKALLRHRHFRVSRTWSSARALSGLMRMTPALPLARSIASAPLSSHATARRDGPAPRYQVTSQRSADGY